MTFANPYLLTLLLLLPLLAWLKGKRGPQAAFLYSSIQLVKGIMGLTRSHVGQILMRMRWLALALFIVALARPQLGEGETQIVASGIDIVVAIDLSGSMAAEDFELKGERVNRLVIAKDVLEKFIAKRPSDRIGLVAFAGRAYIAAPLTLDVKLIFYPDALYDIRFCRHCVGEISFEKFGNIHCLASILKLRSAHNRDLLAVL